MTGSAKQSMERQRKDGLLRRFAPKKKQTDKLLILFNVMDEPPPSVLFHPRGSAKGRCGTRNDDKIRPSDHRLPHHAAAIHLVFEIDHRRARKMPGQAGTRGAAADQFI